jgi:hypothetical protein
VKKLILFLSFLFVVSCTKDPIIYTLTTSANPTDGGTVSPSTQQYDEGKSVSLKANPAAEYLFKNWSGTIGINNPSVVMNSDKTVIANFVKKKYPLTIEIDGEGTVTEAVIRQGVSTDYNSGTIVELTANSIDEWEFVEWKGDIISKDNPTQIIVDKPKSVTAVFINPTTNELLEFSLLKKNNSILKENLIFDIDGNSVYKYIPDFLNADSLVATFKHNGKLVKIENLIQVSDSTENNFNRILSYEVVAINGDVKKYNLRLDNFTKLPVILIDTENESEITSKEDYIEGNLKFIGKDFTDPYYHKKIKIRGRGNYTWSKPKKPFQIKFDKKNSFLDLKKDKKWILLANYTDKTMLRTAIAFEMGYLSNLAWTPKYDFLEVFLNNDHYGTYQVTEKIEEDDNRVNIGKNGYLIEVDQPNTDPDDILFRTPRSLFRVKSPDLTEGSYEYNYIKNYVNRVEKVLYGSSFNDEKSGYKTLIDIDSFVDWYIINEISKNNDAAFYSSCYMTLVPGEKLKMGPIWDFDISFGNSRQNDNENPKGFWIKNSKWFKMMFKDEYFIKKVKERFLYFYENKDRILSTSNELSKKINDSRLENEKIWKTLGKYVYPNYVYKFETFKEEEDYLIRWIEIRFEWLKDAIDEL